MQHSKARQVKDGGGWHWVDTHTGDCRVRGCEPHATREDAQRCQWEAELASATEHAYTSAGPCRECARLGAHERWTNKALQLGGYIGEVVFLCDQHRTPDVLRRHTKPPTERWQS